MRRELLRSVAEELLIYLDGPGTSTLRSGYSGSIQIGKPAGAGLLDADTWDRMERRYPIMEPSVIAFPQKKHSI